MFTIVPFACVQGCDSSFLVFVSWSVCSIFHWIFFLGGEKFHISCIVHISAQQKEEHHRVCRGLTSEVIFFSTTPFVLTRNKFLELGFPSPSKASQLQWLLWEFIETFVPSMPIFDSLCFIFILFFSPPKQSDFFFFKLKTLSEIIKSFLLHFSVGFWGVSIMVISACKATIAACIWN